MNIILEATLSNALIASIMTLLVALLALGKRHPAVIHALLVLVLVKLMTPPLLTLDLFHRVVATTATPTAEQSGLPSRSTSPAGFRDSPVTAGAGLKGRGTSMRSDPAPVDGKNDTLAVTDDEPATFPTAGGNTNRHDSSAQSPAEAEAPGVERGSALAKESNSRSGLANLPNLVLGRLLGSANYVLSGLVIVWLAGTVAWFLVFVVRTTRFCGTLSLAQPAPLEVRMAADRVCKRLGMLRCPALVVVPARVSPMVWPIGWRLRILLPEQLWKRLSAVERETLLTHELAHVKRGDHWVRVLELVATGIFWWHPVVWWTRSKLRQVEERCCDAAVLTAWPGSARSYADTLLKTLDFLADTSLSAPPLASGAAYVKQLRGRIQSIFDDNLTAPVGLRWRAFLVCAVCTLPLSLGIAQREPASSLPKAERDRHPIVGQVVNAAGRPVADADVFLTSSRLTGESMLYSADKSDGDGRFRLTFPASWFATDHSLRQELGIVAYHPDHQLAGLAFPRSVTPPADGVQLALGPAEASQIHVRAPDGSAVSGAQVTVDSFAVDQLYTQLAADRAKDLAEPLGVKPVKTDLGYVIGKLHALVPSAADVATRAASPAITSAMTGATDQRGIATIRGIAPGSASRVRIVTKKYGTQLFFIMAELGLQAVGLPPELQLHPAGKVTGRVVGGEANTVSGHSIRMQTMSKPDAQRLAVMGVSEVTSDAAGDFAAEAMSFGPLTVSVRPSDASPVLPQLPRAGSLQVTTAETRVEIRMHKAVQVEGIVREKGSGRPISNILLLYGSPESNGFRETRTNGAGRFELKALPGQLVILPQVPRPFLPLSREEKRSLMTVIPGDRAQHKVPAIELVRPPAVEGAVIGRGGEPVAQATVRAQWRGTDPRSGHVDLITSTVTTDAHGRFTIDGVDPRVELRLTAEKGGARTTSAVTRGPGARDTATLRISPSFSVALTGRVVDNTGQPLPRAEVRVWHRPWAPAPHVGKAELVDFETAGGLQTDSRGRFETPRTLKSGGEYRVEIRIPGERDEHTHWFKVWLDKANSVGTIRVTLTSVIHGQVVDRRGQAVPEATVFQSGDGRHRVTTQTSAQGQFRLPSNLGENALVFVSKTGYRFSGQLTGNVQEAKQLVLHRSDEPPKRVLRASPQALPATERVALAQRLVDSEVNAALESGDGESMSQALRLMSLLDPQATLAHLSSDTWAGARRKGRLRLTVAKQMWHQNPDEALALVASFQGAAYKAHAYLDFCRRGGNLSSRQKRETISRIVLLARTIPTREDRLIVLGKVAEQLLDIGERQQAAELLREGEKLAQQLPTTGWAGFARGTFAEELVQLDLAAGLSLVENLSDDGVENPHARHHGNIAHELAEIDPPAAEWVLNSVQLPKSNRDFNYRDHCAQRVCYRMASVDLPRARRIADRITDPLQRAYAYGVMAQALAQPQPDEATRLLHRSFDLLDEMVVAGEDQFDGFKSAASTGGLLLSVAENINPALVDEFLWRTVSFRLPSAETSHDEKEEQAIARRNLSSVALATTLAQYDRPLARRILAPVESYFAKPPRHARIAHLFRAAALIDPLHYSTVVENLPPEANTGRNRSIFVRTLSLSGEELDREIHNGLALWYVDDEDL